MGKPNILLLFPDQHRGDWMPYKNEIFKELAMDELPLRMPNIEKLMKEGVTFTRAVTSSPLCAPARACLASGLRYDKCRVPSNNKDFPLDQRTFYSVLKENGYRVGGVGKFDLHKATMYWGLDGWIEDLGILGFTDAVDNAGKWDAVISGSEQPKDPYMKYLYDNDLGSVHLKDFEKRKNDRLNSDPTTLPEEAYCDNWLTQNGLQMLKNFPRNQPWFLAVNFTGPHDPWDVTSSMKKRWENVELSLPVQGDETTKDKVFKVRQNYAAMLENIDRNVGLFIEEIERRGELDNTIIIYTSDHGEMLGDFNMWGKGRPERGSVSVPMVIKGPGIRKGIYSDALVELQDLTATIVEYSGNTMLEAIDSISLKPILEGKKTKHRDYQVSALGDWKMICDGEYKFIHTKAQSPRLYNIREDPWELENIAESCKEIVEKFKNLI